MHLVSYIGCEEVSQGGVEILIKSELLQEVAEVKRVSPRIITRT